MAQTVQFVDEVQLAQLLGQAVQCPGESKTYAAAQELQAPFVPSGAQVKQGEVQGAQVRSAT